MSLLKRTCRMCGSTFSGGPNASYCPGCRLLHRRELRLGAQQGGHPRQVGTEAPCSRCGKPYLVRSGSHKYCEQCAAEVIREKRRKPRPSEGARPAPERTESPAGRGWPPIF